MKFFQFNKIDFLKLRRKGFGLKFCAFYYFLLFILIFSFFFFFLNFVFPTKQNHFLQKDQILRNAVNKFLTRNSTQTLANKNFDIKIYKKNSSSQNKLNYRYPLRYFQLKAFEPPHNLQHTNFYEKHSFPTSFFLIDTSNKAIGLALGEVFFLKSYEKMENRKIICLEILSNKGNNEKYFTIKNQDSCFETRGIMINLWKLEEKKFLDSNCENKTACISFCLEKGLLYSNDSFLQDKLMNNVVTCLAPFVVTDVCLVVGYDEAGYVSYNGGCFYGKNERFKRINLEEKFEFNKTKFFIREPLDPYLTSLNLGSNSYEGDMISYEFSQSSDSYFQGLIISGISLIIFILFGVCLMKTNLKFRLGLKDMEMEEFNEVEMNSSTIKL